MTAREAASPRPWVRPEDREGLLALLAEGLPAGRVARGAGLAPGDQAQAAQVVDTSRLDRLLAFDPATGLLRVEAGVRLAEVEAAFVPRGWALAAVPGHLGGSVGGAIATDAGGMDHQRIGGFGQRVAHLAVATPAHGLVPCGPDARPAFFWANVGGLGLAGVIVEATLRLVPLESSFMAEDLRRAPDLPSLVAALQDALQRHGHARAWLDPYARAMGRGRGVVVSADALTRADLPDGQAEALVWQEAKRPWWPQWGAFASPWLLESWHKARWSRTPEAKRSSRHRREVLAWQEAQAPLWPKQGHLWQAVLPWGHAADFGIKLLEGLGRARIGHVGLSPRQASEGLLDAGPAGLLWTMELGASDEAQAQLRVADELALSHGGRVLLAGDGRLQAGQMAALAPNLARFRAIVERADPDASLNSRWARRVHVRGE